jgi:hypothetical protein
MHDMHGLYQVTAPCLVLQLSADPEGKNMCPQVLKFNGMFYWRGTK